MNDTHLFEWLLRWFHWKSSLQCITCRIPSWPLILLSTDLDWIFSTSKNLQYYLSPGCLFDIHALGELWTGNPEVWKGGWFFSMWRWSGKSIKSCNHMVEKKGNTCQPKWNVIPHTDKTAPHGGLICDRVEGRCQTPTPADDHDSIWNAAWCTEVWGPHIVFQ